MSWFKEHIHFDPPALEAALLDYNAGRDWILLGPAFAPKIWKPLSS